MTDATQRFSSRVENYIKYRPGYPNGVVETPWERMRIPTADSIVADIGYGTGILTEMFLRNGNAVYGIEPNREMREAAERLLKDYPRFRSVAAQAERDQAGRRRRRFRDGGQAFHWFDREKPGEFARILRPHGWIALIWNERVTTTTPFLVAYEQLLKDIRQITSRWITGGLTTT